MLSPLSRRFRLLFLGAPGVGKGTFSKRIAPAFNAKIMTSGDLLREAAKEDSRIESFLRTGQLVPDHIIVPMVIQFLCQLTESFILDGFPRTLNQAKLIHYEYGLDLAVHFQLPYDILLQKTLGRRICENINCNSVFNISDINDSDRNIIMPPLKPKIDNKCDFCGDKLIIRSDDTKFVFDERYKIYSDTTQPIIDFYKEMGMLLTYNVKTGIDDIPDVIKQINQSL